MMSVCDIAIKKGVLTHEVDKGSACLTCGTNCPGFELHFWKKVCKHCLHTRAEHDVQDQDGVRSVAVGKILFSPDVVSGPGNSPGTSPAVRRANKTRSPISTQASNGEVDSPSVLKREQNYVWVPKNTSRNAAEKYLKGLPREKCPIKGTPGERYRNRQLINQLPAYDIDIGQMRQDMSEEEEKQMELFLKMRRDNALGRGQIMEKESADQEWVRPCDLKRV
jgi:prickle